MVGSYCIRYHPPHDGGPPQISVLGGLPHTHVHAESLEEECIERIFKAMQDPSDALFESRLAELMKPTADECPQTPKAAPGAQPPRGSADRKPQGKAAAKATAKASASAASILQKLQALDDGELGDVIE